MFKSFFSRATLAAKILFRPSEEVMFEGDVEPEVGDIALRFNARAIDVRVLTDEDVFVHVATIEGNDAPVVDREVAAVMGSFYVADTVRNVWKAIADIARLVGARDGAMHRARVLVRALMRAELQGLSELVEKATSATGTARKHTHRGGRRHRATVGNDRGAATRRIPDRDLASLRIVPRLLNAA